MHNDEYYKEKARICEENSVIPADLYTKFDVKKGLRDKDGKGVITGITNISRVDGFEVRDGVRVPVEGRLAYRGYSIFDLVQKHGERRFMFEECIYLMLFGELPTVAQIEDFHKVIVENMKLPSEFPKNVFFRENCGDIMNTMARGVLELEAYDRDVSDVSIEHILKQCISIIAKSPMLAVYGYHAHNHYDKNQSLILHRPSPKLSIAENILHMLRPDGKFTALEAAALDTALTIHMEHGGGNNSAFTARVITSAGSDTYSVLTAALLSLKGPKHGGANIKVVQMMDDIKKNVHNLKDEEELTNYLFKILNKEAFDGLGLIYGMGHAVYSISDPRAKLLKSFVRDLSDEKGWGKEFRLYETIEKIAPKIIATKRKSRADVCINVDYYSGLLYKMLGIPEELYTPLFAIARFTGWSAHRIEEIISSGKIIRPAYVSIAVDREYVPLEERVSKNN